MKKYGEIISIEQSKAVLRLYTLKRDEYYPTSATINVSLGEEFNVGDEVEVQINMFLYSLLSLAGYALPFIVAFFTFYASRRITDNIILTEIFMLLSVFLTYCATHLILEHSFFKNISVCQVISKTE